MSNSIQQLEKRHPIQVAARRSGLSQDLLRAWEKRYGVVEPGRSGGRQRLYSDADLDKLRLLRMAVDGGRRISEVAGLPTEQLTRLVLEDHTENPNSALAVDIREEVMGECINAILELDGPRLQKLLSAQLIKLGSAELIEGLVGPLLIKVGHMWSEGHLTIAHEHLATQVARGIVAKILADSQPLQDGGSLVVATTAHQRHEVGGLMAAAAAAQEGWRVVYLGPDLPSDDIVQACENVGADVLALSFSYHNQDVDDLAEIGAVARSLAGRTTVLIGGNAAQNSRKTLLAMGAKVIGGLGEFRAALNAIRAI